MFPGFRGALRFWRRHPAIFKMRHPRCAAQDKKLSVNAYVARTLSLGDRALAAEFQEVACEVKTVEAERIGGAYADTASSLSIVCSRIGGIAVGQARSLQRVKLTKSALPLAVDLLANELTEKLPADLDGLNSSLDRLRACLDEAHAYVSAVVVRTGLLC